MKAVFGEVCAGILSSFILLHAASGNTTTTTEINDVVSTVNVTCPTCVRVGDACYNSSYLLDLAAPFRRNVVIHKMGLARSDNVLYYSFEPLIEDKEYSKVAFVNLDSPDNITGIIQGPFKYNFSVFDINQNDGSIYLGGSDGIYLLNSRDRRFSSYSSKGDTITSVVLMDYLYFSRAGEKGIVKKKGDEFYTILEDVLVNNFVLDKEVEYVVVYLHASGLYAFDSKADKKVRLSKNPFFRGLTVDLDNVVYAWWIDGIYRIMLEKDIVHSRIVKVADITSIGAMVFDNENNIIFTKERSLFKLMKTNDTSCLGAPSAKKNTS